MNLWSRFCKDEFHLRMTKLADEENSKLKKDDERRKSDDKERKIEGNDKLTSKYPMKDGTSDGREEIKRQEE